MFTLGDKLRVLNSEADVVIRDAANAVVATSGAMTLADKIHINGFGSFPIVDIRDMKMFRAVSPTVESKDFTVTAPAGLTIGDAIEVSVFLKTSRYQSELKNNFIGAARPIIFSTAPLTATTPTAIATAIAAAWVNRGFAFHNEEAVIKVAGGAGATDILVAAETGYESVSITKVEIKRSQSGIGSPSPVRLAVSVVNAVGTEGLGTGKFLEESVKMATGFNTNPYGVDQADTQVDIRGKYSEVTFVVAATYDENLSTLAADHGPLSATHRFTVFMNETTMMAANAAVAKMAAAAILAAGTNAGSTVSVQTAPLSRVQEETESLLLADGSSTATVAAFIA